ncbi:NAD(P)-dependent oxidoreductase [Lysobacter korlensis]|uniref:NAD(P)-dependent oxidoreductase n=1 Tax=Lysobacter korlensis TaxID=553636 RepID=A0ABV6RVE7_9GAMM
MQPKPRVVVDPHFWSMDRLFSPADRERLEQTVDVVWGRDEPMPVEEAIPELETAEAIVCTSWRYGEVGENFPDLRAIIDVSGGFPTALDYEACFTRGIHVLSAAPGFARQVAEMSLGLALACSRGIVSADRAMRAGTEQWLGAGNRDSFLLYGKPVGFLGFGSIAQALQPLLAPFGCRISAHDPWLGDGYLRRCGVEPVDLETLVSGSRVLFVLAAPSVENRALLSREVLERIQPGAVLVLISRAHVVDFDALTDLVSDGRFRAAIDVFPAEPPPLDHPIRRAEGAVLSPHRAGSVPEGFWELGELVVDDLEMLARGLPPRRLQPAAREVVRRLVHP